MSEVPLHTLLLPLTLSRLPGQSPVPSRMCPFTRFLHKSHFFWLCRQIASFVRFILSNPEFLQIAYESLHFVYKSLYFGYRSPHLSTPDFIKRLPAVTHTWQLDMFHILTNPGSTEIIETLRERPYTLHPHTTDSTVAYN